MSSKNYSLRKELLNIMMSPYGNPIEVVDFGLSVKWMKCNLAGNKLTNNEYDYGYYYQWGGTTGYPDASTHAFNWSTTPYCNGSSTSFTKYVTKSTYGTIDNKTTLEPMDDAVTALLGSNYRMPTEAEFKELYFHCGGKNSGSLSGTTSVSNKGIYWVAASTTVDGVKYKNAGRLFVGQDITKRVFFPASGHCIDSSVEYAGSKGRYWASSLGLSDSSRACCLFDFLTSIVIFNNIPRYYGCSVRGVKASSDDDAIVDFGLSVKWLKYNLAGDKLTDNESDYGYYYQWGSTIGYPDASTHTFNWSTCPYIKSTSGPTFTKYVTNSTYGTVDNKTTLEPMDDAVTALLGSNYRMPTSAEFIELYNHCGGTNSGSLSGTTSVSTKGTYWVAAGTTVDGVKYTNAGRLFVGQDVTKRVFFPASGFCLDSSVVFVGFGGTYWSSSLYSSDSGNAYYLSFNSSDVTPAYPEYRSRGFSVRGVTAS